MGTFRRSIMKVVVLLAVLCSFANGFPRLSRENLGNPEEYGEYVEGDMRFEDDNDARNAIIDFSKRWPNATVYYTIDKDAFSSYQLQMIQDAFKAYHDNTCVRFVERTTQANYVKVIKGSGCWSYVGMLKNPQQLSLASGCFRIGTVIHEFLHALGFHHEQTRYDRDTYVRINFENIKDGKESNFKIKTDKIITHLDEPYDYGSVMHYSKYAFTKNGRTTIDVLKTGATIGQRLGFSNIDISKINKLYCNQ